MLLRNQQTDDVHLYFVPNIFPTLDSQWKSYAFL